MGCHFLLQGIFPTQGSNQKVSYISCIAGKFFTLAPPRKPEVLSVAPKHRTLWCLLEEACVRQPLFSLMVQCAKEPACQCGRCKRCGLDPWYGKIPWRKARQPTPVFFARRIPCTEESGGLQSMGSQESQTRLKQLSTHTYTMTLLLVMSSLSVNQQQMLDEMSLNRSRQKTKVLTDPLTKTL